MPMHALFHRLRFKDSLTALVSVLITLAALLPLLVTIAISQTLSRPQLIEQSADAMARDAHARVQLIDTYLQGRLHDLQNASQLYALQQYAMGHKTFKQQALHVLRVGVRNDVNYNTWSLLDPQGHALLWYPMSPQMHANKLISENALNQMQHSSSPQISGVFYDPGSEEASIVIAMPIMTSDSKLVGIIRAEVNLTYIWNVVNTQLDQAGSYAFILDRNGVRIAFTNSGPTFTHSTYLFKAIAPLSIAQQQDIVSEDLYGNNEKPVTVLSDPGLAAVQNDINAPSRFETVPAGQQKKFEVAKVQISVVEWTYFALRPLHAIVSIADQQLYSTLLVAVVVLILAIVIGVTTGRRITQPIQQSIEQQKRAYEQQQYLNETKDQILLNVSHELRTPLTEMYGYLELMSLHDGRLDNETQRAFLRHAIGGCEELQRLVTTMLDTVRADTQPKILRLQNISAARTVKEVLDLFSPRTLCNYQLEVNIPETLMVRADQQYLRQILRNLLANAFKYTPPQTLITVNATLIEENTSPAPMVRICVKDSGPGIAPEDIPLLFEKFRRLKHDLSSAIRGSGLGLYICKQLVEAMGGRIWAESSGIAGQGCQFYFTLPCAPNL